MAKKSDSGTVRKQDGGALNRPTVSIDSKADRDDGPDSIRAIGGTKSKAFNNVVANQAINALWLPAYLSDEDRARQYKAGLKAMMEFKPADGIEGMMAAQAVGLHSAAMECLRRAMIPDQSGDACNVLRRQGANLSRAFLDVVAALDRKRGKGARQVVRVERVMVAPGGQAIVGHVQTGAGLREGQHGGGVGYAKETGGEPYATPAQLAHDPALGTVMPPVRSADTGRDAVPVPRDGQRALPNAWRHQHGA